MAYAPIDNGSFTPGTSGDSSVWNSLLSNDGQIYENLVANYAGSLHSFSTAVTGTPVTVATFALPANYDDLAFLVGFGYALTATTADVTFQVIQSDGSVMDQATVTVTASSGVAVLSVTPSATSATATPRYGVIKMVTGSVGSITLEGFGASLAPAAAAAGLLSSGYASVSSTWFAANAPIPDRVVERLHNNPYLIAKDRPNTIFSFVDQVTGTGRSGLIETNSTDNVTVLKPCFPLQQHKTKTYRLWAYVERTGDAKANVFVTIGGKNVYVLDNFGIMTTTFEASGSTMNATPLANKVFIRVSSGTGYVCLRTLQIIEEPS